MTPTPPSPSAWTPAQRRRYILLGVVRPVLTVAVLVVIYYLLPVDHSLDAWTLIQLILGLVLIVAVIIWQVRSIVRSPDPAVQGIEALAIVIPMFLLIYAEAYYVLEHNQANNFTQYLTRTDALYFVVTVFATVGFGDITPVTQGARILVTTQMIGDLLIIGVVIRAILTAVERGRQKPAPPRSHGRKRRTRR